MQRGKLLLFAVSLVALAMAGCGGGAGNPRVAGYRLQAPLPTDLPAQAWVYQVVAGSQPEEAWAQQVAGALGFAGEPIGHGTGAAQPTWSWAGAPQSGQGLEVYGNVGFQCSDPPAGHDALPRPQDAGEALDAARAWLEARELLPADCDDARAWPRRDGLGWQVSFRRRLDGVPVGEHWSWTGGMRLELSAGSVGLMTYAYRYAERGAEVRLKGVEAAWRELQARGPAFFDVEMYAGQPEYGVFEIDEVRLGYHEEGLGTDQVQREFRPYYVFSGLVTVVDDSKAGMAAYVPAWR